MGHIRHTINHHINALLRALSLISMQLLDIPGDDAGCLLQRLETDFSSDERETTCFTRCEGHSKAGQFLETTKNVTNACSTKLEALTSLNLAILSLQ